MLKKIISLINLLLLISVIGAADNAENTNTTAQYTENGIKIDAVLNEPVWNNDALVDDYFITYSPLNGEKLPFKTRVQAAYDDDNLYFAIYCYDDDPQKIKTSIAKRDNISYDDWVSISLDPLGNRQSLYRFYVNPSGIQSDIYETPASGENSAPDWVWESAGRITENGYIVEIAIPLNSIRYTSGKDISINLIVTRFISRLGLFGAWPTLDPGSGIFNSLAKIKYDHLGKQFLLEFIPSITYNNIWDRINPDTWTDPSDKTEFGITAKYGLSSSITAEVTYNPDFSQIESDEFQVMANRRYPVFYSEKRPFFMEASDLFDLAGGGLNMTTSVHTRNIVDPEWGARVTGDIGKVTFGVLAAGDEWPGREIEGEDNRFLGENANFVITRLKYGLNGDNYIGAMYTDRSIGDYSNRTYGFDLTYRFLENHNIKANYIHSTTTDDEIGADKNGGAMSFEYKYSAQTFESRFVFENFDEDFQMDTAFYDRIGIISSELELTQTFNISSDWLHTLIGYADIGYLHDNVTDMDDYKIGLLVGAQFIKQGYLNLYSHVIDRESWVDTTFNKDFNIGGNFGMQITNWFYWHTCFAFGKYIYYHPTDPVLGERFQLHMQAEIQAGQNFRQVFSYIYNRLNDYESDERIYDLNIINSKTTYQFSKEFLLRAIIQYDDYQEIVLADFLASFELIPGTVLHVGYGSLFERQSWNDETGRWDYRNDMLKYYQTTQTLFIKGSYRFQL
ncbi:MAG: carbohydrate binding family 9 domain-containing protein [Acidobacteria bacterium]|nr:carbohydrate binding family 9 domain-containing protein [Acidobacteriota bacterium]